MNYEKIVCTLKPEWQQIPAQVMEGASELNAVMCCFYNEVGDIVSIICSTDEGSGEKKVDILVLKGEDTELSEYVTLGAFGTGVHADEDGFMHEVFEVKDRATAPVYNEATAATCLTSATQILSNIFVIQPQVEKQAVT